MANKERVGRDRIRTEAEFLGVIGTKVFRVIFTVTCTNGFYPQNSTPCATVV